MIPMIFTSFVVDELKTKMTFASADSCVDTEDLAKVQPLV